MKTAILAPPKTPSQASPLPAGFALERYRIERPLSRGGFSTVYLAHDETGTPVAVKEYLPGALVQRDAGEIEPRVTDAQRAVFFRGMKCFFEEGRALARLDHPNVTRVLNFFRANGTVYLVMRFEHGRTLHDTSRHHRGALPEAFVRTLFARLLNGLREVHAHRLLHLDLKPTNIHLRTDGTPVLLDFGAARRILHTDQAVLEPIFTPGFAAPEQHDRGAPLGPWTDIYGVGASLYATLAGAAPPRADERRRTDSLVPLARTRTGGYSADLLELVDHCLRLDPLARPQSVPALQKALRRPPTPAPRPPRPGLLRGCVKALTAGR